MITDCLPASEIISDVGPQIQVDWFYGWTDTDRCRAGDGLPWHRIDRSEPGTDRQFLRFRQIAGLFNTWMSVTNTIVACRN